MRVIQPGTLDLSKWCGRVECGNCGFVAEIGYGDIEYKDSQFFVECPTEGCGIPMILAEARLPRTVRNGVKFRVKGRN